MKRFLVLFIGIIALTFSCNKKDHCKGDTIEKIFVANEESGSVTVFDADNGEVLNTVDLTIKNEMYMAHNIQSNPDHEFVWVTAIPMHGHGDELLMKMNSRREKVVQTLSLGEEQHLAHVVTDESGEFVYVTANESGKVFQVDAEKMELKQSFDLGANSGPHGMRMMDGKLYVACMNSFELAIIDLASGTMEKINVGGIAVQTAVLPTLNAAFVSIYDLKEVVKYDITNGDTTRIPLPTDAQGPIQLYPSPDNKKIYVCDQGIVNGNPASNKLYVIDTDSNTVTSTITVGNGAHGVVTSNDGTKIFVTNLADNTVSVISAETLTVIQTINVGTAPNGITALLCSCED
ncbi:MAG: YncE family protein [Crocinitomicaceae bacterium]|nr:YncE family protein [Crocinitomicaceae bacterium]MBK8926912.1 YncE family protein [Crocinitomicaceae bacterium]